MYKKTAHALSACLPCLVLLAFASFANAQVATLQDADNSPDTVTENSSIGGPVGITAQAANATTYTLSDSAGGLFAINPQSGVVTVADALDYEAFSAHSITVQASDAISSQTRSFVIQITDVPEPLGPVIDADLSPDMIALGAMRGAPVGITARAADPDQGSAVAYSLSEDANGLFAIGRQGGIVTLASDNYDSDQDYLIEVTARSDDGTLSTAQFTVRADKPIRVAPSPTALTIREDEPRAVTFSFAETDLQVKGIGAGNWHSCAIAVDGKAVCWGDDNEGQSSPPSGERLNSISLTHNESCGITPDNRAVCWGDDDFGQLRDLPPGRFIAVAAASVHNCAITVGNEAVCWGVGEGASAAPARGQASRAERRRLPQLRHHPRQPGRLLGVQCRQPKLPAFRQKIRRHRRRQLPQLRHHPRQ